MRETLWTARYFERQRELMNTRLQNRGYWAFQRTLSHSMPTPPATPLLTDLTLTVHPPVPAEKRSINIDTHRRYIVRNVSITFPIMIPAKERIRDTTMPPTRSDTRDITILYGRKRHLSPDVLYDNCFIRSGRMFSERDINRTYQALGRLQILKFTNIRIFPSGKTDNTGPLLDVLYPADKGAKPVVQRRTRRNKFRKEISGVAASVQYPTATSERVGNSTSSCADRTRRSAATSSQFIHNRMLETGIEASIQFPEIQISVPCATVSSDASRPRPHSISR